MKISKVKPDRIFSITFWSIVVFSIFAVIIFAFLPKSSSIWLDEAYSILIADNNLLDILKKMKTDNSPPLYFFVFSIWIKIFGIGEYASQAFSGLMYALSVLSVYLFCKKLHKHKLAIFMCTFLFAMSPITIFHSQNIRMYSMLGFFSVLSTWFFIAVFQNQNKRKLNILLYCLAAICGTFTHMFFQFVVFSQIIAYFAAFFSKKTFKIFLVAMFISLIPFYFLWAPILLTNNIGASVSWITKFPLMKSISDVLLIQLINSKIILFLILIFSLLRIRKTNLDNKYNLKINLWNARFWRFFRTRTNTFLSVYFITVLLAPLITSQFKPLYWPWRGMIIAAFPFSLLLGSFFVKFVNRFVVLAISFLIMIVAINNFYTIQKNWKKSNIAEKSAQYLIKNINANDVVIFTSLSRASVEYYTKLKAP
ncbi:glycosyltransferase family 39 protein, partial [bacterium]